MILCNRQSPKNQRSQYSNHSKHWSKFWTRGYSCDYRVYGSYLPCSRTSSV